MKNFESPILEIKNLYASYGEKLVVSNFNLNIYKNQTVCITGKSGIGKTTVAMAIAGGLNFYGGSFTGQIYLFGKRIDNLPNKQLIDYCKDKLSIMVQDSSSSLNPTMTVGSHIMDVCQSISAKKQMVLNILSTVGFDNPVEIFKQYPYNLSGGMKQKVCLAMAIINQPKLLILDESYSNVDIKTQEKLLRVIDDLKIKNKMSVLLITHNKKIAQTNSDKIIELE